MVSFLRHGCALNAVSRHLRKGWPDLLLVLEKHRTAQEKEQQQKRWDDVNHVVKQMRDRLEVMAQTERAPAAEPTALELQPQAEPAAAEPRGEPQPRHPR